MLVGGLRITSDVCAAHVVRRVGGITYVVPARMLSRDPVKGGLGFSSAKRVLDALLSEEALDAGLPKVAGYILTKRLGHGGGGAVFAGHREDSDRSVAVKLLDHPLDGGLGAQRAWRELDVLTQLRLPCTPQVHDYGIHEGCMYIATDHVEGLTLSEYCRSRGLNRRQRVELLFRIAEAVQSIHEHGVIHRDLKPENILIDAQGRPVIIDLGISIILSGGSAEPLTAEGMPIGTPGFMSPEQARGEQQAISTRSDVYSLAATACCILTGRTPHDTDAPLHEAIRRVAQDQPRNPRALDPSMPRSLGFVLAKALSPEPAHRYASAAEFAEDLRRWHRGEPIGWTGPSIVQRARFWFHRNPGLALMSIAAAVGVTAAIVLGALAIANAAVAQEREQLAADQAALVEALETYEQKVMTVETKRAKMRRRQVDRVKLALQQGALFDASIVLLNLAEEIEAEQLDDRQALLLFTSLLDELIEAAGKEGSTENQDPGETE